MGSGRALLFDYHLVAGLMVLLVATLAGVIRWFDLDTSRRWATAAAGGGFVAILAMFSSDVIDVVNGRSWSDYPNQPEVLILLGFGATTILGLAAYDSLTTRIGRLTDRVLGNRAANAAVLPTLVTLSVLGLVGALSVLRVDGSSRIDESEQVPATNAATSSEPTDPMTLALHPSPIGGGDNPEAAPELILIALTRPGELRVPTFLASPPGDDRIVVLEREGRVRVIEDGEVRAEPLLDITESVRPGTDGGLLGLAFHPGFASNGRMFVLYTDLDDDNRLVEYEIDPTAIALVTEDPREIIEIEQPTDRHAGGTIQFGPDGFLYISVGDGGEVGDPANNGQTPEALLGGILRIDVDAGLPYGIPAGNAFGGRDANETFAYGLRNPYRFWIDPATNRMFIGDAGEFYWEEIDTLSLDAPGTNFGWSVTEGTGCFLETGFVGDCDRTGLEEPIVEYQNARGFPNQPPSSAGCAVLAGPVYRGRAMPDLAGRTFYADFCRNWIISFLFEDGRVQQTWSWEPTEGRTLGTPISFGVDADGEMYLLTSAGGMIYKFSEG